MTFDSSLPDSGASPSVAPGQIQTNFSVTKEIVEVDHKWEDTPDTNYGKHNKVSYLEQSTEPTPATNEIVYFSEDVSGTTELYSKRNGESKVRQTVGVPDTSANGYTYLPGGLLLQWGTYTVSQGTSSNLNFPTAFGTVLSVNVSAIRSSTASVSKGYPIILSTTPTTTTFKVNSGFTNSHSFYMQAIGTAP